MTLALRSGDASAFFDAPFNAYRADSAYVSPLRSDLLKMLGPANPLIAGGDPFAYWTAHRDRVPVGRISALVHRASNTRHGTRRAQFGFFDCADDPEAAAALLGEVERFAAAHGCDEVAGNFNLTAMQQAGVQTSGFGRAAYTDMIVNPPHVPRLLEANGFARFFPMTTFELDLTAATRPRADLPGDGYDFAPVTKRAFSSRMEDARIVLNDGFSANPMFVPLTRDEFTFQAGEMMAILDPRLSTVLRRDDVPVGVIICIPDLNPLLRAIGSRMGVTAPFHFIRHRLRRRRAVIIYYSVAAREQRRGLNSAMLARVVGALQDAGYTSLGITWIADVNAASLRQMEKLGAKPLNGLHLFRKGVAC